MQKIIIIIITFSFLSCNKKEQTFLDGIYYNNILKELLIIKEGGNKQVIYNILENTTFNGSTLQYNCLECPNEQTTLELKQIDSFNIKIIANFKSAIINDKLFQSLKINHVEWDSISICTSNACQTIHKDNIKSIEKFDTNFPLSLIEEIDIVSNSSYSFYNKVIDDVPVDITFYFKNSKPIVKKTDGLKLYLRNLRYFIHHCLKKKLAENNTKCNF